MPADAGRPPRPYMPAGPGPSAPLAPSVGGHRFVRRVGTILLHRTRFRHHPAGMGASRLRLCVRRQCLPVQPGVARAAQLQLTVPWQQHATPRRGGVQRRCEVWPGRRLQPCICLALPLRSHLPSEDCLSSSTPTSSAATAGPLGHRDPGTLHRCSLHVTQPRHATLPAATQPARPPACCAAPVLEHIAVRVSAGPRREEGRDAG